MIGGDRGYVRVGVGGFFGAGFFELCFKFSGCIFEIAGGGSWS